MEAISNQTMTVCQHCHKATNYANDAHYKARESEIAELRKLLSEALDVLETETNTPGNAGLIGRIHRVFQ